MVSRLLWLLLLLLLCSVLLLLIGVRKPRLSVLSHLESIASLTTKELVFSSGGVKKNTYAVRHILPIFQPLNPNPNIFHIPHNIPANIYTQAVEENSSPINISSIN